MEEYTFIENKKYTFKEAADEITQLIKKHITNPDYLGIAGAQFEVEGLSIEFIDRDNRGQEYIQEIQEFLNNYKDTELKVLSKKIANPIHIEAIIWDYGI